MMAKGGISRIVAGLAAGIAALGTGGVASADDQVGPPVDRDCCRFFLPTSTISILRNLPATSECFGIRHILRRRRHIGSRCGTVCSSPLRVVAMCVEHRVCEVHVIPLAVGHPRSRTSAQR